MPTAQPLVSLDPTEESPPHGDMQEALQDVGSQCRSLSAVSDTPLTDDAREEAIKRAGVAMEAHWNRYQATHAPGDRTAAITACNLMAALIRGRSPSAVEAMEKARGLR
jgi:hypothetical protein